MKNQTTKKYVNSNGYKNLNPDYKVKINKILNKFNIGDIIYDKNGNGGTPIFYENDGRLQPFDYLDIFDVNHFTKKKNMKNQIKVQILEQHINRELPDYMSWFTIMISGVPRSVLQEASRHRTISPSIQSTRYVLKKQIKGKSNELMLAQKGDNIWGKYLWLENDNEIDKSAHNILSIVADKLEKGYSTDKIKTLVPEGLLYTGTYTMDLRAWRHLYSLRSGKEVYEPFRLLVERIKEVLDEQSSIETEYVVHSSIYTCSTACRTCWDSFDKSDKDQKDRELVKRVGVQYRHRSVLESLVFRFVPHDLLLRELTYMSPQNKYIDTYKHGGQNLVKMNMRTVLELLEDESFVTGAELLKYIPKEYMYLLQDN